MVQSVKKAMEIIDLISGEGSIGVRDLSSKIGMPRSTVGRLLRTLVETGYLVKDEDSGKYGLSYKMLRVGHAVLEQKGIGECALPVIKEVAEKTGETVNLTVLDKFEVLYIEKIESSQPLKTAMRVGTRVLPHCTASGKVMLAQLDVEGLNSYFERCQLTKIVANTITEKGVLLQQLADIRSRGFAISRDELLEGVSSVAAAIRGYPGKEVAALSIAGPSTRFSEDRIVELGKVVTLAAQKVSNNFLNN